MANDVSELRHRHLNQAELSKQETVSTPASKTYVATQRNPLEANLAILNQQVSVLTSRVDALVSDVKPLIDFVKTKQEKSLRKSKEKDSVLQL